MRDECEHGSLRRSCTVCDLLDDVRDLEQERDALGAYVGRLTNAALTEGAGPTLRSAVEEGPAVSLAHVRAEAIEEAAKACMPGPCNPPDDPPQGYQEYCEGVASVKQYAESIRQSAKQTEITDEQGRPMTYWGGEAKQSGGGDV